MGGTFALHLEQTQRIQNFGRISTLSLAGQEVDGEVVQRKRGRSIPVEPTLANRSFQGRNVLFSRVVDSHEPAEGEEHGDPTDLLRRHMKLRGKDEDYQAGQAVAKTPDDGVYKPLGLHPRVM